MLLTASAVLTSCFVAIVSVVLSYLLTRRNQRELEALRAQLEEQRRERDSRRDYEYEARKRLYAECGPILLQLSEAADSALRRIVALARTARQGHLGPEQPSWLANPRGYFFLSTLYLLFTPLAVAKVLQRRLTLIDFTLDRETHLHYVLARELLDSFSSDHRLAARPPALAYHQRETGALLDEWESIGPSRPQGAHRGLVDAAIDTLLVQRDDQPWRVRGFTEFESGYRDEESALAVAFRRVEYVVKDFHPRTHPVCWRVLITQAYLYRALLHIPADCGSAAEPLRNWAMSAAQRRLFEWRTSEEPIDDPFTIAEGYLAERFEFVAHGRRSLMAHILAVEDLGSRT